MSTRKPFEPLRYPLGEIRLSDSVVLIEEANAAINSDREHYEHVHAKWIERAAELQNHVGTHGCDIARVQAERDALKAELGLAQVAIVAVTPQLKKLRAQITTAEKARDDLKAAAIQYGDVHLSDDEFANPMIAMECYDRVKAQLSEAVELLSGCTSANCRIRQLSGDGYGTANVCQCAHRAGEYLSRITST